MTKHSRTKGIWSKVVVCFVACLLVWVPSGETASLTLDHQIAKDRGIILYNQYKARSATPFLTTAAEAGDPEAQFFLGESLRQNNRFMTSEAKQWLEAAADQGHVYSMIRLARSSSNLCSAIGSCPEGSRSPGEWYEHAYDAIQPLAEQGNAEAMFQMYKLTLDADWRARAAEAGHSEAQYWHAAFIEEGAGSFWWPGSRQKEVEKWFKASAEGGYPLGMMRHAGILADNADDAGYRYWMSKAASTGYARAVYALAALSGHEPERHGIELDLVKSYGLLHLLLELDGGGSTGSVAKSTMPDVEIKMTPEQIQQALEFAEEWKASHPPLSYFPHILHALDN